MKQFFAGRAGLGLCGRGGVCLMVALAACTAAPVFAQETASKARVATLELEGALKDRPDEMGLIFGKSDSHTLQDVVEAIKQVGDDDALDGIVIQMRDAEMGATQVEEISAAIREIRGKGKKVHLLADAYGTVELMLGAACDEVIAQTGAPVSMPGLYMEEMFLADTLAWAGLKADYVQVGDYKGASEQMARSSPSPQWSQNIEGLLDSMYANIRGPMLRGRELTDKQLDTAMEKLWMADSSEAKDAKLIDSVIDLPQLSAHLKNGYGKQIAWKNDLLGHDEEMQMDMSNPFAMLMKLGEKPDYTPTGPTIAVVHIDGAIMDGDSTAPGIMGGSSSVGSRTIRKALEDIRKEDEIRGVVVRIDSPGGSATASEVIWQGVRRLAEKKPVWVSVGGMAASGGYYIAVAGDKIYVNPSSIVGSIGVVGGKIAMGELYDKLKVNVVGRGRGPKADMFASEKVWTDSQRDEVRAKMTETYEQFTSRVTAGRKEIDLSKTAEGRLFTGDKAIGLKMADAIGGLDVALQDMAKQLELDDFEVMHYPAPRSFADVLEETFGGLVKAPGMKAPMGHAALGQAQLMGMIQAVVGERAFKQLEPQINGYMQMREGKVLLMSPKALIFKK
ncbi:MAG TPA: signal peptide peptidase SppA [Phycisphaerales bacterium]|nr:signal peptide peptidase SppA [Phycisphaerales bacterium]